MLSQPFISLSALKTFERLAKMNNRTFLQNLQNEVNAIVANLPRIQVTGASNQEAAKQMILNLFFWLKPIKYQQNEQISSELSSLKQIIALRALVK